MDKRGISEWEAGKPRTTRHNGDQTLFNAAAQTSFVTAAQVISRVNLDIIVQMIRNCSMFNKLILNVAHVLKAEYVCISITLVLLRLIAVRIQGSRQCK